MEFLRIVGLLLLVLLIFNFMILVHEWGHFLAARWRGLQVDKFQIWFGKPIWKKTYNGVQYGLGSIPLGGFVALPQMAPMEAIEGSSDGTVNRAKLPPIKPLDKIIVAFAGPLFSFLLALAFACIVWVVGKPETQVERDTRIGYIDSDMPAGKTDLQIGDRILSVNGNPVSRFMAHTKSVIWEVVSSETDKITFVVDRGGEQKTIVVDAKFEESEAFKKWQAKPWYSKMLERPPFRKVGIGPYEDEMVVAGLMDHSPAALAGLQKGDKLLKVNGKPISSSMDQSSTLLAEYEAWKKSKNLPDEHEERFETKTPILFTIQRGEEVKEFSITPKLPDKPANATMPLLGVSWQGPKSQEITVYPTPWEQIQDGITATFNTLKKILPTSDSKLSASHMNSAVGIVTTYYDLLHIPDGWKYILWFSVILNVNLAFLNMLPFPVLDGGHITLAVGEWIRGRAPRGVLLGYVQTACVLLLFSFMLWVLLKDVGGLGDRFKDQIEFLPPQSTPAVPSPA
jgi:regulator of sigma E protease